MKRNQLILIGGILFLLFIIIVSTRGPKETAAITPESPTKIRVKDLVKQAGELEKEGKIVKAKEIYQEVVSSFPDYENIEDIQGKLEGINLDIIFSNVQTPKTVIHEVQQGDTLGKIAKKYGTTIELIKRSNNLKSDIIRIGQRLRIWTGKFNVLVDKSQNILILKDGNEVLKVYPVSTGANNSTPVGVYKIISKLVDPVWFNSGVVVPPESPQNVLGSRWLGFDLPGYGIHGTIEPETIGQQVTAGCIRMRKDDVEELYSLLTMGTEVVVVD